MSRYQKGKTSLDFTEARDSEWQRYQLGHMQVCTSRQRDNHASTPPLSFLQAGCPSCCPTNSVKALKAILLITILHCNIYIASKCLEHCVFLCELYHINVVNNSVHRNSYYYKLRLFWMTYSFFNVEIPEL